MATYPDIPQLVTEGPGADAPNWSGGRDLLLFDAKIKQLVPRTNELGQALTIAQDQLTRVPAQITDAEAQAKDLANATGTLSPARAPGLVPTTDARLSDARTPLAHTQAASTITGLATVATSGKYSDLAGQPTIPSVTGLAPLASPAFTGTPTGITKTHVGLGNVDNTADASKPVSTAQATAILDAKNNPVLKTVGVQYYSAGPNDSAGNPTIIISAADLKTLANDLSPNLPAGGVSSDDRTKWDAASVKVGNSGRKEFNTLDYYTDASATTDDTALTAAITACIAEQGRLLVRPRRNQTELVTASPLIIKPADTQSEIEFDMDWLAPIRWNGTSGNSDTDKKAVIQAIGVRRSIWNGVRLLAPGSASVNNLVLLDIDTRGSQNGGPSQNSASSIILSNFDLYQGKGTGNVGARLGQVSGGGGDVSQIKFNVGQFTGGGDNGLGEHIGAQNAIDGQIGLQIKGRNVLNYSLDTVIFSYLNRGYSNKGGGNGAVKFLNAVWSHCKLDSEIQNVQNYTFDTCRSEDSLRALHVSDSSDSPQIMYLNCIWDNLVTDSVPGAPGPNAFFFGRPGTVQFINGAINNAFTSYGSGLMRFNNYNAGPGASPAAKGLFVARGLQVQGAVGTPFFTIEGEDETPSAPRWRVEVKNCPALNSSNAITGYYTNRDTI